MGTFSLDYHTRIWHHGEFFCSQLTPENKVVNKLENPQGLKLYLDKLKHQVTKLKIKLTTKNQRMNQLF